MRKRNPGLITDAPTLETFGKLQDACKHAHASIQTLIQRLEQNEKAMATLRAFLYVAVQRAGDIRMVIHDDNKPDGELDVEIMPDGTWVLTARGPTQDGEAGSGGPPDGGDPAALSES